MEPRQARRGTAAVASSTLLIGVALVVLAFVLSACGSGSDGAAPAGSTGPSTGASPSATGGSGASDASSAAVPTTAPATTAGTPAPVASDPAAGVGTTQAPVGLDQPATFAAGLTATVISIEPITATAALPGEVAGPAVRLTLAVQNGATAALDLGNVTVDLQDAQASSATPLSGNGSQPFTGSLAPGASSTGVYVFSLADDDRAGVTLYVTATASLPVVVFTGNLT